VYVSQRQRNSGRGYLTPRQGGTQETTNGRLNPGRTTVGSRNRHQ
jgi:hypothetical protein